MQKTKNLQHKNKDFCEISQKGSLALVIFFIIAFLALGAGIAYLKFFKESSIKEIDQKKEPLKEKQVILNESIKEEIIAEIPEELKKIERPKNETEAELLVNQIIEGLLKEKFGELSQGELTRIREEMKEVILEKQKVSSRDSKRIGDMRQLQAALTNYYYANMTKCPPSLHDLVPNFINAVPKDPDNKPYFYYISYGDNRDCILKIVMEDKNNKILTDIGGDDLDGIQNPGNVDCSDPAYCLKYEIFY